MAASMVASNAD